MSDNESSPRQEVRKFELKKAAIKKILVESCTGRLTYKPKNHKDDTPVKPNVSKDGLDLVIETTENFVLNLADKCYENLEGKRKTVTKKIIQNELKEMGYDKLVENVLAHYDSDDERKPPKSKKSEKEESDEDHNDEDNSAPKTQKKQLPIAVSPVIRLFKRYHDVRLEKSAQHLLSYITEEYVKFFGTKIIRYTNIGKQKTISLTNVENAIEDL